MKSTLIFTKKFKQYKRNLERSLTLHKQMNIACTCHTEHASTNAKNGLKYLGYGIAHLKIFFSALYLPHIFALLKTRKEVILRLVINPLEFTLNPLMQY